MILVPRKKKPDVLVKNENIWQDAIAKAKDKKSLEKAISKYKHNEIKEGLSSMFNGKCAFCESYIENVDYGHIEHYKPKSKFPKLSVIWDNLLLACAKCNGKGQKGDEWPTKKDGGPLINPTIENPDDFFDFEFDEITKLAIVKAKTLRGGISEQIYGLNKHTLLKDRNIAVRKLFVIAKYYHTDAEAKDIIDRSLLPESEYSAFAKMIKNKFVI